MPDVSPEVAQVRLEKVFGRPVDNVNGESLVISPPAGAVEKVTDAIAAMRDAAGIPKDALHIGVGDSPFSFRTADTTRQKSYKTQSDRSLARIKEQLKAALYGDPGARPRAPNRSEPPVGRKGNHASLKSLDSTTMAAHAVPQVSVTSIDYKNSAAQAIGKNVLPTVPC